MNEKLAKQTIHGERITVARVHLAKGAVVPRHSHSNEQISMPERGKVRFMFDDGDQLVESGQVLTIPPNMAHAVEALEDSIVVDLFSPIREDWIRGDDAYLR